MTATAKALKLERVFDASPERLWTAWTDPVQYAKWLNPAPGLDLIIHEFDVRVGGRVRFDMPQPDGNPHPQSGVFHELQPHRRIVTGAPDRSFLLTVTFEPAGTKTRMVVEATGVPAEFHAPATQGWNAGFDKLDGVLAGTAPKPEAKTLRLERFFDCSVQALWDAWTRPELLAKWFGPFDPDNDVHAMDVRPGGRFRLAMVDGAGDTYPVWGEYRVVDAPRELVFTAEAAEIGDHVSTVTVRIEAVGTRTRLTFVQTGIPPQVAAGTSEGWRVSWDKLATFLSKDRVIVISRVIDAPRERVFDAFTDAKRIGEWWGPTGFRTTTHDMDVRPGGLWRFTMHGPDGTDYPNWVRYEEVVRPERLAWAHGGGKPGDEPEFHTTVTLAADGTKTRVTLRSVFPTAAARAFVVREHNAIEGGKETLARLALHVAGPGGA